MSGHDEPRIGYADIVAFVCELAMFPLVIASVNYLVVGWRSWLIGIGAAVAFAFGTRPGLIAGAVLLQIAFTFDCVDGQLARYTHTFTRLGAWLDSVFDRGKEYVVFAGLAIGAAHVMKLFLARLLGDLIGLEFQVEVARSEHTPVHRT